ncbi:pitrilysin family protein [Ideonella sp. DXS29W]|uniref:Pitrilysin family protein n=1 Tax=Ideonella lacteola TaxID=2984193 RepID=A0ABU9BLS2_9BURK
MRKIPSGWLIAASAMLACAAQAAPARKPPPKAPARGKPVAAAPAAPAGVAMQPVRSVEGITEYRLPNGLQVLLAPDDAKPTTTVNLTYRVGSRHENYGETGMAHLLEHLLFKGSPKYPKAWAEFTKRGLRANGSTWLDRTNYFASFTANEENLKWYLGWQADAMINSFIARKDLDTEMTVVRNEMEMGENNPSRILFEKTLAMMYQWHNYGHDTIGARADVENVDIGRLQAFYRQYYQPDNATLIVSGKFDPAKVVAWVQAEFSKIPVPKRQLPKLYTIDPVQDGERAITLRRNGGVPLQFAAYHVPPGAHPDTAAVELLGLVMSDVPAGRLHKKLVEGQLAASVFSWNAALADPGFALFGAQLAPGQDADKAREAMLATIESVTSQPITEEEVNRARAKWLKDWDLRFSDPETVGVALSETVAQGDWRLFFLLRDRVKTVTAADLNRVAAERFLRDNRTLASYVPTDKPTRAPKPENVNLAEQLKSFKPVETVAKVDAFDASPANIESRTQRFEVAPGMKVSLLPKATRGDVVNAQLSLRLGDEESLKGQSTSAELLGAMLDKGTAKLSRQQLQDRLTELKAEVQFGGSPDHLLANVMTTRENLPAVIELVSQMLREPSFPADALEEVRRQVISSVEQSRKEPEAIVEDALDRHGNPYPKGDVRYARTFDETVAEVNAVTVAQIKAFHQRFVGAGRAQFAAVGSMDVAAVRAALEKTFGGWNSGVAFKRVPHPLLATPPARLSFETPDKQNATMLVRQAVPLQELDPDQAALMVANFAFGSGGNSRLWKRIREAEGLSYDVRSGLAWNAEEANTGWQASAIFAPQNRAKVEKAFKEEVERAIKEGFTADEIAQAKAGLLNFRRLARAQDGNLAGGLANNEYLGRKFTVAQQLDEAISAVTPEQAGAAWRKYIDPQRFVSAVAGDFKGQ